MCWQKQAAGGLGRWPCTYLHYTRYIPCPDVRSLSRFPNPSATSKSFLTRGFTASCRLSTERTASLRSHREYKSFLRRRRRSFCRSGKMAPKLKHQQELRVDGRHMIQGRGSLMYDIPPTAHWESCRFSVRQGFLIRQWNSLGRGARPISVNLASNLYWLLAGARQVVVLERLSCLRLH